MKFRILGYNLIKHTYDCKLNDNQKTHIVQQITKGKRFGKLIRGKKTFSWEKLE